MAPQLIGYIILTVAGLALIIMGIIAYNVGKIGGADYRSYYEDDADMIKQFEENYKERMK